MKSLFQKIRVEEVVIIMLVVSNFLYFNSNQKYKNLYESSAFSKTQSSIEYSTPNRNTSINDKQSEKLNPHYFDKQKANLLSKTIFEQTNKFLQESGFDNKVNSVFFVVEQLPHNQLARLNSCQRSDNGLNIVINVSPEVIQHQNQLESEIILMKSLIPCLKYTPTFI